MNCVNHPDRPAVSSCNVCGVGLCPECTSLFTPPLCRNCAQKLYGSELGKFIAKAVITGILLIIGITTGAKSGVAVAILYGYVFACIPWGWAFLNRITPNVFLFLPLLGWIIYFIIKLLLAICVGAFVAPFRIVKEFFRLKGLSVALQISSTIKTEL